MGRTKVQVRAAGTKNLTSWERSPPPVRVGNGTFSHQKCSERASNANFLFHWPQRLTAQIRASPCRARADWPFTTTASEEVLHSSLTLRVALDRHCTEGHISLILRRLLYHWFMAHILQLPKFCKELHKVLGSASTKYWPATYLDHVHAAHLSDLHSSSTILPLTVALRGRRASGLRWCWGHGNGWHSPSSTWICS
jgi:hypothetical protein